MNITRSQLGCDSLPSSKGTMENPMTHEEILAKFRATAGRSRARDNAEDVIKAVDTLESAESVAALMASTRLSS